MKFSLKSVIAGGALVGSMLAASAAHAVIILDAWQLDTTNAGINSITTNIGELSLSGGLASIEVEVAGPSFLPFVGAAFTEDGVIFSVAQVQENCAGACDSGFPQPYQGDLDGLQIVFTDIGGFVTSFNAGTGEIGYVFTSVGSVVLQGTQDNGATWVDLANLQVIPPSGGSLGDFSGAAGTNGDSTILGLVLNAGYTSDLLKDSAGNSLDDAVANNGVLFNVRTNNEISTPVSGPGACSFASNFACRTLDVGSNGSANLARVPEPGSLALLGAMVLAAAGVSSKRMRRQS